MRRSRNRSQGAEQNSRLLDTGLVHVWTQKSSTPLFVPLTGALDSTHVYEGRVTMQLAGITGQFQGRMAYRMSDDGIVWSATVTNAGPYKTSNGWFYSEDNVAAFTTDQKLYVQFGVQAANVSGTQVEHGLVQLQVELRNTRGQSLFAQHEKVWSDGSTTQMFLPLTEPVRIEQIGEYRATLELVTHSGDLQVQPAYQVSNDKRVWYSGATSAAAGTFATFGSNRSSNGIDYGTTFTSFAPSEKKRFVRFGVGAKNGSAGKAEAGLVKLRVDVRRT